MADEYKILVLTPGQMAPADSTSRGAAEGIMCKCEDEETFATKVLKGTFLKDDTPISDTYTYRTVTSKELSDYTTALSAESSQEEGSTISGSLDTEK